MNLEAIDLVNKDGHYFLVDVNTFKPTAISHSAYQLLTALKQAEPLDALRTSLGEGTVAEILEQFNALLEQGAISARRRDFRGEVLAMIAQLQEREPSVREGVLMVAQTCNLACRYCYGGDSGNFGRRGLMTEEVAERCLRYVLSANGGSNFQKIVFLGGEPLLNFKVIQRVVGLWEEWQPRYPKREVYFSMTTNGTVLTPQIVQFLKEKNVGITVSIDGPREMHDPNRVFVNQQGSYERVMAGIELLRRHGIKVSVRTTMTRHTDIRRLHDFFVENDFELEYLIPVDFPVLERKADYQLDLEAFRRLTAEQQRLMAEACQDVKTNKTETFKAKQLSMAFHNLRNYQSNVPFRCPAAWGLLAFDVDGRIYPCQRFVGHQAYCIGDVDQGVDKKRVVEMYRRFLAASDGCNSCWAVHLCRRRCFFQKAKDDGSFEQIPEQICDVYRDNYVASMVFAQRLQAFAKDHEVNLDEVLTRYDTGRLMREHKARQKSSPSSRKEV